MKTSYVIPAAVGIGAVSVLFARSHPGWMVPIAMGLGSFYLWTRKGSPSSAPAGQWSYAGELGLIAGAAYGVLNNVVSTVSQQTAGAALGSAVSWPGHPGHRYDWQQQGGGEKPVASDPWVHNRYYHSPHHHPYVRKGFSGGRPLP
jgi:hypothetical protein